MVNNTIGADFSANKSYTTSSQLKNNVSNDEFKKVLNTETNKDKHSNHEVKSNTEKVDDSKNKELKDKVHELKDKVVEDKEETKNENKVEVLDETDKDESKTNEMQSILAQLLNALEKFLDSDKIDTLQEENNALVTAIIEEVTNSSNTVSSDMEKLLQLLSDSTNTEKLDSEVLTGIKELLATLSAQCDESTEIHRNFKSGLDEITAKVNELLNGDEKVLTLEDILNKSYPQNDSNSSENSGENSSQMSSQSKATSKEDKFLNSLLDDNNSFENKINIFSNRIQNNAEVNTEANNLTINKATFSDDLIQDVKYMSTNDIKELVVKVNPGNLGQVTIELVQEDGVMKANLKANSKETTALLAQNLAEIKKELGDQNIKIAEVNVELYKEDTTFFRNGEFGSEFANEQRRNEEQAKNKVNGYFNDDEEQEVISNIAELNNNVDLLV